MTTTILWNGSKFLGDEPDSVDVLIELMGREPLDREQFGDCCGKIENAVGFRFFGNFANVSHAFCIESDDAEVCARLIDAIRHNPRATEAAP